MWYFICIIGGAVLEWLASYLIGRSHLKDIVEKDIAYVEAKLAALKKAI